MYRRFFANRAPAPPALHSVVTAEGPFGQRRQTQRLPCMQEPALWMFSLEASLRCFSFGGQGATQPARKTHCCRPAQSPQCGSVQRSCVASRCGSRHHRPHLPRASSRPSVHLMPQSLNSMSIGVLIGSHILSLSARLMAAGLSPIRAKGLSESGGSGPEEAVPRRTPRVTKGSELLLLSQDAEVRVQVVATNAGAVVQVLNGPCSTHESAHHGKFLTYPLVRSRVVT
jgi:hypothetical protein